MVTHSDQKKPGAGPGPGPNAGSSSGGGVVATTASERVPGGQPGVVELRGSLVKASGQPTESVRVNFESGLDLNNVRAPLAREMNNQPFLTSADKKEIAAAQALTTVIGRHCLSHALETLTLNKARNVPDAKNSVWTANLVVLCREDLSKFETLRIVADRVIFDGVELEMVGTKASRLEIVANTIEFKNRSSILTKGADNLTEFGAPGVSLVAEHVAGLGSLTINAKGGDRRREEEKKSMPDLWLPPGP